MQDSPFVTGQHPVSLPDWPSPKDRGYYFPAEFEEHSATWLSWPHKEASWPGKIHSIYPA
ncbi:MAG TPA: agmatine deiminase family protein, partial [Chitinophagaceae bacterium]|nr:agmatine deiminase family protein [Chitinophagaceae bacterium]